MKLIRVSVLVIACSFAVTALASAQGATAKPASASKPPAAAQADAPAAKLLPKPVLDAFKKTYPAAVIKGVDQEKEGGKITWEVESIDGTLARDLVYNPDGTVVSIEEAIPAASLPPAVAAAFKAKYPKATITKAEKVLEGKVLTYELTIKGAGTTKSVEFTPEGKLLPPEKKGAEKDEKPDIKK